MNTYELNHTTSKLEIVLVETCPDLCNPAHWLQIYTTIEISVNYRPPNIW